MDYIQVENGNIKGYPRSLPKVFADVSNFHVLGNDRLIQYGWYPVRVVSSEKDVNTIIAGYTFVIEENEVVQYENVRQKTQEELNYEIEQKWKSVRMLRNGLLNECDWTQLNDVALTESQKQDWLRYRQLLRDLPSTASDPDLVLLPQPPI
jgi:hypothetical protein